MLTQQAFDFWRQHLKFPSAIQSLIIHIRAVEQARRVKIGAGNDDYWEQPRISAIPDYGKPADIISQDCRAYRSVCCFNAAAIVKSALGPEGKMAVTPIEG